MSYLALSALFEYICYGSTAVINSLSLSLFNPCLTEISVRSFHTIEAGIADDISSLK